MDIRCEMRGCVRQAHALMYWPGASPSLVCEECLERAEHSADQQGFTLRSEPLPRNGPDECR